jgi:polar amino acid transport system substrate-binding protein
MLRRILLATGLAAAMGTTAPAQAQALKVGSTPTGVPFTFLDTRSNSIQGMMVDLIAAIGKHQGFATEVQATPFAALVTSLTTSRIDIISAAMLATPARREVIDFSDPVYAYGEGLVVPAADTTAYTSLADFRGRNLAAGVQIGTVYVQPLQAAGAFSEVRTYDSIADIMRDVNLRRLGAGFGDAPIIAYQIAQGTFTGVRLVSTYKPSVVGSIAIGVRKNDPLLGRINAGLATIKANGELAAIIAKWNLPASAE